MKIGLGFLISSTVTPIISAILRSISSGILSPFNSDLEYYYLTATTPPTIVTILYKQCINAVYIVSINCVGPGCGVSSPHWAMHQFTLANPTIECIISPGSCYSVEDLGTFSCTPGEGGTSHWVQNYGWVFCNDDCCVSPANAFNLFSGQLPPILSTIV